MPASPKLRILAGTDIGTSKTVTLIAVAPATGSAPPRVIGRGIADSAGMRKGVVRDLDAADAALREAISLAEREAARELRATVELSSTLVTLAGAHLISACCQGTVPVTGVRGVVRDSDVAEACESAKNRARFPGAEFPNHVPVIYFRQPFRVGRNIVEGDPRGMKAASLTASYWGVAADSAVLERLGSLVGRHIENRRFVVSSYASGSLLAAGDAARDGVLVVDIGAGVTDFILLADGHVALTGSLPVGGELLTRDLCAGLRLPQTEKAFQRAEQIKRNFDPAVLRATPAAATWRYGDHSVGDTKIPVRVIAKILEARLEELFVFILRRLGRHADGKLIPRGVILTGGGANLRGAAEIAERTFGLKTRVAGRQDFPAWVPEELQKPEYSAALGLLAQARTPQNAPRPAAAVRAGTRGLLSKLLRKVGI
ncbi:MAG: cell division protein FtsA [Puniceicoccales bacterium]|jgi:cell division protein FtsA|nr:cell division protein FtsA [Puniceicoccales bacterium]